MELSNNEQQIKLKAARVPQHQNLSVNETQTQPQSQLPHHFKPKASFKKTRDINAIDFNKTVP